MRSARRPWTGSSTLPHLHRTTRPAEGPATPSGRPHNPLVPLILFVFALLGGAVAAIFAPLYLDLFRRELSRADELEQIARELGLRFSKADPAYPGSVAFRYPFELFSRGIEQTCENFITGTIAAVDVTAFDFLYRIRLDADDAEGHARSEPIRFSCALASVAGQHPHVVIEPASAPLQDRADGEPVRLEWGDFNARYRVISPDRGFATTLLDLGLMAWLVDDAPALPLTWEIQRDQVLCRAPRLAPRDIALLVTAVSELARRVSPGSSE
jgi:hypothetical protein